LIKWFYHSKNCWWFVQFRAPRWNWNGSLETRTEVPRRSYL